MSKRFEKIIRAALLNAEKRIDDSMTIQEYADNYHREQQLPPRVLEEVRQIREEREDDYGNCRENFESTAIIWEGILRGLGYLKKDVKIEPQDVALMMIGFKVSRACMKYKRDNLADIIGYADCMDEIING